MVLGTWLGAAMAAPPSEATDSSAPTDAAVETGEGDGDGEPEPATSSESPPMDERATRAAAVSERARQIGALIDGTLDPEISVTELFTIDLLDPALGGPGGESLRSLLSTIQATREALQARSRAEAEAEQQLGNKRRPSKRESEPELPPLPEPSLAGPEADALTRAQSQLAHALWRFLTLAPDSRAAVLDAHLAKQRQIANDREAEARARARLERLRSQAAQLEALIDGTLDVGVDPASLLRIDLSDAHELGDEQRLARLLGSTPTNGEPNPAAAPDTAPAWAPSDELAKALAEAEAALDSQRMRFMALDAEQRAAVLATHQKRQQEAEDQLAVEELIEADEELLGQVEVELTEAEGKAAAARREREQAEAAAAAARSEALRRMGEERARLLGVKEAHANYEVVLKKIEKDAIAAHEIALHWDRDVHDLATRDDDDAREQAADAMYADLRAALADARNRLHETLDRLATNQSGVEPVGEPLAGLPQGVDRSDLQQLRDEVVTSEAELRELEDQVVWRAAELGRDDIVTLNRARLMLLDLASDDLHARMTGFGIDGVAQVEREIEQIGLELRYRLLSLPRFGRSLLDAFERSPLPVVFAFLQLAFVILVFRWWRQRAARQLEQWRAALLARDPSPARADDESSLAWTLRRVLATGLWYLARVRRPLEWLLLFALVFRVVLARGAAMVEIEALWLVILWLLVGSTVILFVDALAAHENLVLGRGGSSTAKLRIRSLRLVGLTIVWTGLMLSLTEEIVGMGAIHKWVRSLVWLAAIPIVLLLIHWWREPAFRRIENDPELPDSALVRWIRAHDEGWTSFAAAALAGAYLFTRGIARWLLRRATSLELTRRMMAWMFRREVLRQANARREGETPVRVLDADERGRFNPNATVELDALSPTMRSVGDELVGEIVELAAGHRGTLSAVIGERGSGKSTLLRRIEQALVSRTDAPVTVHRLQCPPGGVEPLLRAIAEVLGVEPGVESMRAALAGKGVVFLIDDAHRIVRPAIGGLDGLDRLADFARFVRDDASWVLSIGAAAWQYVSRARGERVFFDQVRRLPAWNEREIGELIRERSVAAGIQPNFDEIVIPRQFDVATVGEPEVVGERPDPRARAELGFYRILWDYAKGNPAVALHFWSESLRVATEGEGEGASQPRYVVRLFAEPPASELDDVGPTMHFVLRAVVQLEVARPDDLVACTQLPADDVADALRFACARGWIARVVGSDERYRVTWHWYRAITDMLRRQHLLAI